MLKYQEQVILVDINDQPMGFMEKLQAHKEGKLHRAVSVFVFNDQGYLLIQKRAFKKYHSGFLWANTACTHPYKGEEIKSAIYRRLKEEMGFDCPLHEKFSFVYKAVFDNDLREYEFDHVFIGNYNGVPSPNDQEVVAWRWITINELKKAIKKYPKNYAVWFKIIINKHLNKLIL